MGMSAYLTIIFYDADGDIIFKRELDCWDSAHNSELFKVPKGAVSMHSCYATEYVPCKWRDCRTNSDDSEDSEEERLYNKLKRKRTHKESDAHREKQEDKQQCKAKMIKKIKK
jgi:hypothetical protein